MKIVEQPYKVHDIFKPLYSTNKRYTLITGGRGSLKSSNVHEFVMSETYKENTGVLFTRYTMTSANKSILPHFEEVIERHGVSDHFKISNSKATNIHTGSFILFSGIKVNSKDQTANLKSLAGINIFVVEEGEDFNDEKKFDIIDDSIRTIEAKNRVIWIQNPTTREHFIYSKFIAPKSKQIEVQGFNVTVSDMDNVEHIHTTYHIGEKYLSEDWKAKAEAFKKKTFEMSDEDKHKSHYYYNYIGGWLEKAEGVIFPTWTIGNMDTSLPYGYGLDYGFFPDPNAMVKLAVDQKRKIIYIEQKLYKTEQGTEETIQAVKARLDKAKDLVVADHEKRTTDALRKAKINIKDAVKGPDSVINGIRSMQDYEIVVCGLSPDLKKELNNYVWNDKKASIPIDKWNHLIDASRYIFKQLTGKRKRGYGLIHN